MSIATQVTRVTLDAARTIASGESIVVHGIVFTNNNAGSTRTVIFRRGDGTGDPILKIAAANSVTYSLDEEWLADNGLSIDIDVVQSEVTVFHSAGGR
jgi:hypothetical protein